MHLKIKLKRKIAKYQQYMSKVHLLDSDLIYPMMKNLYMECFQRTAYDVYLIIFK